MQKFSDELLQRAIDINDTVVFEYNIEKDIICFSDNIDKYIPVSQNVSSFTKNIHIRGKVHPDDLKKAISFFSVFPSDGTVKMEYIRFLDFNGEFFWYQLKGRCRMSADGRAKVLYGTMTYIDDETKHHNEELEKSRDQLTHLYNNECFCSTVNEYLKTVDSEAIPNLIIVDVDDFEGIRELNSDISADGVLIEISRILKRAFRGTDIIGRLGFDRFAVFMKGVRTLNILEERSDYVRKAVKDVWGDLNGMVTVSVGIAVMYQEEADATMLIERANTALLDAKNSGGDMYVMYDAGMHKIENNRNPILTTKEMELVKNILDPMCSFAYAVDDEYHILYTNEMLANRIKCEKDSICYSVLKGYDEPCPDCPIKHLKSHESSCDSDVYSTSLRSSVSTRTTRIKLRNGREIYLVASIKENVAKQEETITESKNRVQQAVISMQDIIWDVDVEKNSCIRIKENNVQAVMDKRIKNYQMLREYYLENVVYSEDRKAFVEATDPKYLKQAKYLGTRLLCHEVRLKSVGGEYTWYNVYSVVGDGDGLNVLVICLNVDEYVKHRLAEIETKVKYEIMKEKSDILKEIALSNERHENVNEMTGILVYEYQVSDNSYYLCPMFDEIFDIDKKKLTDRWSLIDMLKPYAEDETEFYEFMAMVKQSDRTNKRTVRLYNKNGVPVWYTIIIQPLHGLNNVPVRYLATFQNVDSEMKIKMEMEYRANYDSLTGLYNCETFYRKASTYIHLHEDESMAIISVDIDKFRIINDRYGIEAGNNCLAILGKHLREMLSTGFIANRYQGDMFSVLIKYDDDQELLQFMNALTARMRDDKELPTSVSLVYGIYKIVDPNVPVRLMCDRARAVKRQMKGTALTNYAVYDDVIRLKLREQAEIESEMEMAIKNHEFVMYLQPQINIKTGKICGAEALVRWKHPTKGVLVPAHFLPLFENNGFITRLDIYMWEEACKYIKSLQERGIMLPISVNVSRLHVGHTDIVEKISDIVKQYGFDNRYLEIEITENLFMEDVSELFEEMEEMKRRGFRILMDDFGSGYSSLNMLRRAPIDTLKIDRFFLDEIMSTDRGKIIVESSVRMAKMIGLDVIAEGVETKEQLDFLASIDCDVAQGYYYSRPISIDEFEEYIKTYM